MRTAWLERVIWLGLILAGIALAACVWVAWPVAAAPPTAKPPASFGPAPVPSELEQSADYVPGADLTPARQPVVR